MSAACGWLRARIRPAADAADQGSLMLYMIPVSLILLLFAGLVLDGGTALATRGRAADLAQQSARSAANALSPASLRAAGPEHPRIDPAQAQEAGRRVLAAAGATGTVTVRGTQTVTVTAHVHARTVILSAIGITDASGSATASATVLTGTTSPDPSADPSADDPADDPSGPGTLTGQDGGGP